MPKAKSSMQNSLKRQIAVLKREVNPIIVVKPVRGNPKPCNINKSVYVSRTVQIVKESAATVASLARSDIISAVNTSTDIRIDFIKVWNTVPGSGLKATLIASKVIDATTSPKDIQGEDFGTNASLAGLKFDIPMTLATDVTEGATTDGLVTTTSGGATDKMLFQVGLRMAV